MKYKVATIVLVVTFLGIIIAIHSAGSADADDNANCTFEWTVEDSITNTDKKRGLLPESGSTFYLTMVKEDSVNRDYHEFTIAARGGSVTYSEVIDSRSTYYLLMKNDSGFCIVMGKVVNGVELSTQSNSITTPVVKGFILANNEFIDENGWKYLISTNKTTGKTTATLLSIGGIIPNQQINIDIPEKVTYKNEEYTIDRIGRSVPNHNNVRPEIGQSFFANYHTYKLSSDVKINELYPLNVSLTFGSTVFISNFCFTLINENPGTKEENLMKTPIMRSIVLQFNDNVNFGNYSCMGVGTIAFGAESQITNVGVAAFYGSGIVDAKVNSCRINSFSFSNCGNLRNVYADKCEFSSNCFKGLENYNLYLSMFNSNIKLDFSNCQIYCADGISFKNISNNAGLAENRLKESVKVIDASGSGILSGIVKTQDTLLTSGQIEAYSGGIKLCSSEIMNGGFSLKGSFKANQAIAVHIIMNDNTLIQTINVPEGEYPYCIIDTSSSTGSEFDLVSGGFTYRVKSTGEEGEEQYEARLISLGTVESTSYEIPAFISVKTEDDCPVVYIGSGSSEYGSKIIENPLEIKDNKLVNPPSFSVSVKGKVGISDYAFTYIVKNVVMPAYYDCGLNTITFEKGVSSIGRFAFCKSGITSINLDGVESIGSSAFSGSSLESVVLPNSIKEIGSGLFSDCPKLKTVKFNCFLDAIPSGMFSRAKNLNEIIMPTGCTAIGSSAFSNTAINFIDLKGITSIGDNCFSGCSSLATVKNISLSEVPYYSFHECSSLKQIQLPQICTIIGQSAFSNSGLESINLDYVKIIGSGAFASTKLGHINLKSAIEIGDSAFGGSSCIPTLGSNIKSIGKYAFRETGITTLGDLRDVAIGEGAFNDCTKLDSVSRLPSTIADRMFEGCTSLIIEINGLKTIGMNAFEGTAIVGADLSGTTIGSGAFKDCTKLVHVSFGEDLTGIPNQAFDGCVSLTDIELPEKSFTIGESAFQNTGDLKLYSKKIPMTADQIIEKWNIYAFKDSGSIVTIKGDYYTLGLLRIATSSGTLSVVVSIDAELGIVEEKDYMILPKDVEGIYPDIIKFPKMVVEAENTAYSSYDGVLYTSDGKTLIRAPFDQEYVAIREGTETIADSAFRNCAIKEISIPGTVKRIGDRAFQKSNLTTLIMAEGVESIGEFAFLLCPIDEVVLPNSIKTIGKSAFASISGHVLIGSDSSLESVGERSLAGESQTNIVIPKTLVNIGSMAFGMKIAELYLCGTDTQVLGSCFQESTDKRVSGITTYVLLGNDISNMSFDMIGGSKDGKFGGFFNFIDGSVVKLDGQLEFNGHKAIIITSLAGAEVSVINDASGLDKNQCAVSVSTPQGHTVYDLVLTVSNITLHPAQIDVGGKTMMAFILTMDADIILNIDPKVPEKYCRISFDSDGGSKVDKLKTGVGMTVLAEDRPIPTKNNSEFIGWFLKDGTPFDWSMPISSNLSLIAHWKDANPAVRFHTETGEIKATMNGSIFNAGDRVPSGQSITFEFYSIGNVELKGWYVTSDGKTNYYPSKTMTLTKIQNDTTVSADIIYASISNKPTTLIDTDAPTASDDLILYWSFGGKMNMSGMKWTGHSSVPLIIDDYVYLRVSNALYMVDIDTGLAVRSVTSENLDSYYHYLGYAHGLIFDYSNGKVYDAQLNPVKDKSFSGLSSVFADDDWTYIYTKDDNSSVISKYSADLSECKYTSKLAYSIYGMYGTTSMPVLDSTSMYWLYTSNLNVEDHDIGVASMDRETGKVEYLNVEGVKGHLIDDGWLTYEAGKLYFTTYRVGLFSPGQPSGELGKIVRITINHEDFTNSAVDLYDTDYTLASGFEIYNGRGYLNIGSEFRVYDVATMKMIYKVKSSASHGGIVINTHNATAENNYRVSIYMIPYSPGAGLYIFTDSQGQTSGLVTRVDAETPQYNSQAVRSGPNGELIWYSDSGQVYCFGVAEKNNYYYYLDDGERSIWLQGSGSSASDALDDALSQNGIDGKIADSGVITSIWGKAGWSTWTYAGEMLDDKTESYGWRSLDLSVQRSTQFHYWYISTSDVKDATGKVMYYRDGGSIEEYSFDDRIGDKTIVGKMLYDTRDIPVEVDSVIDSVYVAVQDNTASISLQLDYDELDDAFAVIIVEFADNTFQRAILPVDDQTVLELKGSDKPMTIAVTAYDGKPDLSQESPNRGVFTGDLKDGDNAFEVAG